MHTISCLIALSYTIVAMASAHSGYLVSVGPSPLRFQRPPAAITFQLPPLPKETPSGSVGMPAEKSPACVTSTAESPMTGDVNAPVAVTNEAAITPETLVELFRQQGRDKRSRETAVVLSPGFIPPAAPAKPSSTATYEQQ
jgi:hypothetical protein